MDAGLLKKIFGAGWSGACVVLVDADATVKTMGQDSIVAGGMKSYAPRVISGRVAADAVAYLPDYNALAMVQRYRIKLSTGEDVDQQTLHIVDAGHVAGVEFEGLKQLEYLGLQVPPLPDKPKYAAGTLVG